MSINLAMLSIFKIPHVFLHAPYCGYFSLVTIPNIHDLMIFCNIRILGIPFTLISSDAYLPKQAGGWIARGAYSPSQLVRHLHNFNTIYSAVYNKHTEGRHLHLVAGEMRRRPNLLELPVDIISLILTHLLLQDAPIALCPCTQHELPHLTAILLTHPAVHAIAAPLFYQGNLFALDMTGTHSTHVRRAVSSPAMRECFLLTTPSALARIGSLHVQINRLRGWIDDRVVPILQAMAVSGSLTSLDVYFLNRHDTRMFPNGKSRDVPNLLKLLAEPDLQTARLWVSPGDGAARAYGKDGEAVDWRSILAELDPEGREVAVRVAKRV